MDHISIGSAHACTVNRNGQQLPVCSLTSTAPIFRDVDSIVPECSTEGCIKNQRHSQLGWKT